MAEYRAWSNAVNQLIGRTVEAERNSEKKTEYHKGYLAGLRAGRQHRLGGHPMQLAPLTRRETSYWQGYRSGYINGYDGADG
jgi:hypothetical protein